MMKVSVVIPTYNRSEHLNRCVKSLLKQEGINTEIIVVDDGSIDDTSDLINGLKNKRLKYLFQKNSGPSKARNRGMDAAKGDLIVFLDDDCLVEKDFLKNIISSHKENKDFRFIGGRTHNGIKDSIVARTSQYIQDFWLHTIHAENKMTMLKFLKRSLRPLEIKKKKVLNFIPTNNLSIKNDQKKIRFDENFKSAASEDLEFCWKWAKKTGVLFDPKIKVTHMHRNSLKGLLKQYYNYGKNFNRFMKNNDDYSFNDPDGPLKLLKFIIEPLLIPFLITLHVKVKDMPLSLPIIFLQESSFRIGYIKSRLKDE